MTKLGYVCGWYIYESKQTATEWHRPVCIAHVGPVCRVWKSMADGPTARSYCWNVVRVVMGGPEAAAWNKSENDISKTIKTLSVLKYAEVPVTGWLHGTAQFGKAPSTSLIGHAFVSVLFIDICSTEPADKLPINMLLVPEKNQGTQSINGLCDQVCSYRSVHTNFISNYWTKLSFCVTTCFGHQL